jgi:hypothetical protein
MFRVPLSTRIVEGALIALLTSSMAHARPPANPDPALAPWFQSLQQPGTGISCCSIADCRPTDYRTNGDLYEVLIAPGTFDIAEPTWLSVPHDKVLQRTDNPVGRAVVCWTPSRGIMCFVRGTEA